MTIAGAHDLRTLAGLAGCTHRLTGFYEARDLTTRIQHGPNAEALFVFDQEDRRLDAENMGMALSALEERFVRWLRELHDYDAADQ